MADNKAAGEGKSGANRLEVVVMNVARAFLTISDH